ncbi:MAG: M20/M25/M40 family metallo-hydrolase, partial [Nitrososphaerales archaeon]
QLYAQLMGLKSVLATNFPLRVNVKFIFEGEEENGSPHLEEFIITNKEHLKADFVYTSDGPLHESGRPVVQLGVRGILYLEFTAKGASRDLHSGNWGGPIMNPALKLIDLITTMREPFSDKVLIEGFYDNIRKPTDEEKKILQSIPLDRDRIAKDLGLDPSQIPSSLEFYTKLMFQPTFNICGFISGYTGKGMKTIIPSKATLKMDMRLVADQDPEDIFEKVQQHVKKYAPGVHVEKLGQMKPSRTPVENKFVKAVYNAVERATGFTPLIYPSLGGSLPDYVFTGILGIPSIMVPYANIDESNHAPNENLAIPLFIRGVKCFSTLLAMLSQD